MCRRPEHATMASLRRRLSGRPPTPKPKAQWAAILADAPLPHQDIALGATNPITGQAGPLRTMTYFIVQYSMYQTSFASWCMPASTSRWVHAPWRCRVLGKSMQLAALGPQDTPKVRLDTIRCIVSRPTRSRRQTCTSSTRGMRWCSTWRCTLPMKTSLQMTHSQCTAARWRCSWPAATCPRPSRRTTPAPRHAPLLQACHTAESTCLSGGCPSSAMVLQLAVRDPDGKLEQ